MKPRVYKDWSWVLKVYTSGWIPVKLTGFSSANARYQRAQAAGGSVHDCWPCACKNDTYDFL